MNPEPAAFFNRLRELATAGKKAHWAVDPPREELNRLGLSEVEHQLYLLDAVEHVENQTNEADADRLPTTLNRDAWEIFCHCARIGVITLALDREIGRECPLCYQPYRDHSRQPSGVVRWRIIGEMRPECPVCGRTAPEVAERERRAGFPLDPRDQGEEER